MFLILTFFYNSNIIFRSAFVDGNGKYTNRKLYIDLIFVVRSLVARYIPTGPFGSSDSSALTYCS